MTRLNPSTAPILDGNLPAVRRVSGHALISIVTACLGPVLAIALRAAPFSYVPCDVIPQAYSRDFSGGLQFAIAVTLNFFCPVAAIVYGVSACIRIDRSPLEIRGSATAKFGIVGGAFSALFVWLIQPML